MRRRQYLYSNDDLIEDLKRVRKIAGGILSRRLYELHGKRNSRTIRTRFGTWLNAMKKAGYKPETKTARWRRKRRELILELKRMHSSGDPITFNTLPLEKRSRILYYFGGIKIALKTAGIPLFFRKPYRMRDLMEDLRALSLKLGRTPLYWEITKYCKADYRTYLRRFGSMKTIREMALRMLRNRKRRSRKPLTLNS